MVKFVIVFHQPESVMKFENSYNDLLALIERMTDITRRQVVNVLGSPMGKSPYYRILEVYFEDEARMRAALLTPAGQEAGAELTTRFPRDSFDVFFADVYEETGGRTPRPLTALTENRPTNAQPRAPETRTEPAKDDE